MIDYRAIATQARRKVLELIYRAQTSHLGSNFSAIDLMAVLFEKMDLDRDKFVLSAGWKAASLYYFLWKKGRITEEQLNSYCQEGSPFIGLAEPVHQDIPFAGGSMCMGIAAGVGFALAKKLKNEEGKVYVLESDGGLNGGITWEAVSIASQHHLNNLVILVDVNGLQAMGKTEDILNMQPIEKKFSSFGWHVHEIRGHNYKDIIDALMCENEKPTAILAKTVKGKGWKRAQDNNVYHYKAPSEEEYKEAVKELI